MDALFQAEVAALLEAEVSRLEAEPLFPQSRVASTLAAQNSQIMQEGLAALQYSVLPTSEVPRVPGERLTMETLRVALEADVDGNALVEGMFTPPSWATWDWADHAIASFDLGTQYFQAPADNPWAEMEHAHNEHVRQTCVRGTNAEAPTSSRWPNRRFDYPPSMHGLTVNEYMSEAGALTGLRHFGGAHADEAHMAIELLIRAVLGASPEAARWTRGAQRRILSIGARGAGTQFHTHGPTWLALVRGVKLWWLGPAWTANELIVLGNNASAPATCAWLAAARGRPHPAVRIVVQRAGDVLVVGEQVVHATCDIEDSMAVGAQMGFYDSRWMDLRVSPAAEWKRAALCREPQSVPDLIEMANRTAVRLSMR